MNRKKFEIVNIFQLLKICLKKTKDDISPSFHISSVVVMLPGALEEWRTHCVQLRVYVAGVISSQDQNPGWHVARVLTGHQDGKLSIQVNTHVCTPSLKLYRGLYYQLGPSFLPDDNSFVHVNIDEMRASAAIGFPVCFRVFVSQFVSSVMIGRDVHLLPALILRQLHTGA